MHLDTDGARKFTITLLSRISDSNNTSIETNYTIAEEMPLTNGDRINSGRITKSKSMAQLRDGTAASWLKDLQAEQEQMQAHIQALEEKASEHDQLQAQLKTLEQQVSKLEWQKKLLEIEKAEMRKVVNECATAEENWATSTMRKDLDDKRFKLKQMAKKYPDGGEERKAIPNTQGATDGRLPLKHAS